MKRKTPTRLGETELEVLDIVWELGTASVADVLEIIQKKRKVAYTTVMTVMRKLADKGYLDFKEEGRTYLYSPRIPAEQVRGRLLSDVVSSVFGGSRVAAVRTLVESESLSNEQIDELRALVNSLGDEKDD